MEFLTWLFSSSSRMFFAAAGVLVGGNFLQYTAKAKHMSGDVFVALYADMMQPVVSALDSVGLIMVATAAVIFVLERVKD